MKKWVGVVIGLVVVAVIVFFVMGHFKNLEDVESEGGFEESASQSEPVTQDEPVTQEPELQEDPGIDVVYKMDSLSVPPWVYPGVDAAPWKGSIYLATSSDGKSFSGEKFFVQHAGVPDLLLTDDGKVVAIFQYFSYSDQDYFDRIAYTVSEDRGESWSNVKMINFDDEFNVGPTPVDPTLVQLSDGRYRLYFTYHKHGMANAALFSVSSMTLDGVFESEGMQLSTDGMLLDPAVIFFKDEWHHYTPDHSGSGTIHSVSADGLNFVRKDNIASDYQFLGGGIEDGGKMRFYGTGNGVVLAESSDGYSFSKVKGNVVNGADPGVVKFPDGEYLIVYNRG
jgi:hypothetical protein